MNHTLQIQTTCPVKAQNAGQFISRGDAMHPTRILSSHELIFVIQGKLEMWEANAVFHLVEGDTLLLFAGHEHGSVQAMPPDLKFYWIHFEIESEPTPLNAGAGEAFNPTASVPQWAHLHRPETLERLFRMFINEQETGTLFPPSANMLAMLMLLEVAHNQKAKTNTGKLNTIATWAHSYIRMNFDRPISAGKVAAHLGYNVDYLGRVYRDAYGCTLTEAIHRRRIEQASAYLLNSHQSIGEIARHCGFSDTDYFRRIFKRHMKVTPTEYRQENSPLHVTTH